MWFSIDGSTAIHLYALDDVWLPILLDYFTIHWPSYLAGILSKNHNNDSPLDIAIENDAPWSTELMMKYLVNLSSLNISKAFYDKFPELFSMNLPGFNEFLSTCIFQTDQMK